MTRIVSHRYSDPLDLVWLNTAHALGMKIERSDHVFASWDGVSVLTMSTAACFDDDDSLAQMIFHEICHALVAGPQGLDQPDWGLENTDDRDRIQEQATHRLQAALADRHGLRAFLAVTTEHRPYFDSLGTNPLSDCGDHAVPLARAGWLRAQEPPWAGPLEQALSATRSLARIAAPFAPPDSLWNLPDF